MGFITTRNPRTGREVFCCDFCGKYPAKRVRCPYNYCQKWAICADCRKAGKARLSSCGNGTHKEICYPRHLAFVAQQEQEKALLETGAFVRCAALNQDVKDGVQITRVCFRDKHGKEKYAHMADTTYHAIDYGVLATPEDYAKHGEVVFVNVKDLYAKYAKI